MILKSSSILCWCELCIVNMYILWTLCYSVCSPIMVVNEDTYIYKINYINLYFYLKYAKILMFNYKLYENYVSKSLDHKNCNIIIMNCEMSRRICEIMNYQTLPLFKQLWNKRYENISSLIKYNYWIDNLLNR